MMAGALHAKLRQGEYFPALTPLASELLALRREPTVPPDTLVSLLMQHATLAGDLLTLANSAMFPSRQIPLKHVSAMVRELGAELSLHLALSLSLQTVLRSSARNGFDFDRFWQRAVLSALIAHCLGRRRAVEHADSLFAAAFLQDVGILALSGSVGEGYDALYQQIYSHRELMLAERDLFGADHAQIGMLTLGHWQLPLTIIEGITLSHALEQGFHLGAMDEFRFIVATSGALADLWSSNVIPNPSLSGMLDDAIARIGEEVLVQLFDQVVQAAPAMAYVFGIELLSCP